jgi:hypothetical protein
VPSIMPKRKSATQINLNGGTGKTINNNICFESA